MDIIAIPEYIDDIEWGEYESMPEVCHICKERLPCKLLEDPYPSDDELENTPLHWYCKHCYGCECDGV